MAEINIQRIARTLWPWVLTGAPSREYEISLWDHFPGVGTNRASEPDDFFRGELYDDAKCFGVRRRRRESANYIKPINDDATRHCADGLI